MSTNNSEQQTGYVLVTPCGSEIVSSMAERLERECHYADSYTRLGVLLNRYDEMLLAGYRDDWFRVFGKNWTCCDNIGAYRRELRRILPRSMEPLMMTTKEMVEFNRLPDALTFYRGAERGYNERGLSWSLDRAVAERFPFTNRYRARTPVLVIGRAAKRHVVALKNGRDECELIITYGVRIVGVEQLPG